MKTYFAFFILMLISSAVLFAGGPIPGADVKRGRKPPGGNGQLIGSTDSNGNLEIKDLQPGKFTYFVEIVLPKTGKNFIVDNIALAKPTGTRQAAKPYDIIRSAKTKEYGDIVVKITVYENKMIVNLQKADIKKR